MSGTQVITEKNIKKNVIVTEKNLEAENILKDLEESYKEGLISKETYEKAKRSVLMNKEDKSEKEEVQEVKEKKKDRKKEERDKKISFIKRRHVEELKKMKENWIKDLESLRSLYEHGVISEEEYERSKIDIEEKIGKIEEIIKKELEVEELEELKERIEKEIREAFDKGIFKEEESKLKKDLEALDSLFERGLISKEEYQKKRELIESQLENYSKLIDLIDAIFDKFIEEINQKIEENKEATKQKEIEEPKEGEVKKEVKKYPWYLKLLHILGLYEIKEEEIAEINEIEEQIKKAYKESEMRFKISNMALVIKRRVKEIMNIDKALTYKELIDYIDKSDKFDENIKVKLRSYFQAVMLKEYLEKEDEKDIENIYKESLEIAKLLSNIEEKKRTQKKPEKEKSIEEKGKEEVEEKKEEKEKKKGIFERINEFFGV